MSGGFFDYQDSNLKNAIFGYSNELINVFEDREISELVFDVLNLIHDFDYYRCGDTCKQTWLKAKTVFKKKWLDNRGQRIKRIVDMALAELKEELYETYGLEDAHENQQNGLLP